MWRVECVSESLHSLYTIVTSYPCTARSEGQGVLRNSTVSLWSASLELSAACAQVAGMRPADLRAGGNTSASVRFIYDNGVQSVLPAYDKASSLHVHQVRRRPPCFAVAHTCTCLQLFSRARDATQLQLFIFLFCIAGIDLLALFVGAVLTPILHNMQRKTSGVSAVIRATPPHGAFVCGLVTDWPVSHCLHTYYVSWLPLVDCRSFINRTCRFATRVHVCRQSSILSSSQASVPSECSRIPLPLTTKFRRPEFVTMIPPLMTNQSSVLPLRMMSTPRHQNCRCTTNLSEASNAESVQSTQLIGTG